MHYHLNSFCKGLFIPLVLYLLGIYIFQIFTISYYTLLRALLSPTLAIRVPASLHICPSPSLFTIMQVTLFFYLIYFLYFSAWKWSLVFLQPLQLRHTCFFWLMWVGLLHLSTVCQLFLNICICIIPCNKFYWFI